MCLVACVEWTTDSATYSASNWLFCDLRSFLKCGSPGINKPPPSPLPWDPGD